MIAEPTPAVDVSRLNADTLIFDNPVLVKHVRSRLRKQHIVPSIVMVVILAALAVWSCFRLGVAKQGVAFVIICSLQGFLLFLMGTSQVATAIAQARETGILDFHRVSPLRAVSVTMGYLLGAPIREWMLFACLIPFSLANVAGGNPSAVGWLKGTAAIIVSGLLCHSIAALVGATSKPRTAGGAAVGIVLLLFLISSVFWRLTPGPAIMEAIGQSHEMPLSQVFFGVRFSQFVLGLLHQIPLIIFLLIATVRRIRRERAFVYSKSTAILFLLVLAAFMLGDTYSWTFDRETFQGFTSVFSAYFMTVAGILLTTAITPGWGDFANGIRRAVKAGAARPGAMADMAPNRLPVAAFSLIAFAVPYASSALRHVSETNMVAPMLSGLVAGLSVLLFGFAQQTFQLTYRRNSKAYFGLFLFLVWIVPPMVAIVTAVTDMGDKVTTTVLSASPLAGICIAGMLDSPDLKANYAPYIAVIVPLLMVVAFVAWSIVAVRKAEAQAVGTR